MNIVNILKKFFEEQQGEAAIPGLGVFYKSNIDEQGAGLEGESYVILFKEKTPRSNAFVNFLGYDQNLTEADAMAEIEHWVNDILTNLKQNRQATIDGLGRFTIQDERVLFYPESSQTTQQASTSTSTSTSTSEYGLNTPVMPIGINNNRPTYQQQSQKMSQWLIAVISLVVLILVFIVVYRVTDGFRSSSSEKAQPIAILPVEEIPMPAAVVVEPPKQVEPVAETPAPAARTQSAKPVAKRSTPPRSKVDIARIQPGYYYVIGGVFSSGENANKCRIQMEKRGLSATIILFDRNKDMYYVALALFDTRGKAENFKEKVKRTHKINACWVYDPR
ncbi:hypothetical protein FACS1894201_01510 [Bacteroidia bacterium]|nr:hypothetical protein FACS1894201_01510 [Bacteroidia bacterium]